MSINLQPLEAAGIELGEKELADFVRVMSGPQIEILMKLMVANQNSLLGQCAFGEVKRQYVRGYNQAVTELAGLMFAATQVMKEQAKKPSTPSVVAEGPPRKTSTPDALLRLNSALGSNVDQWDGGAVGPGGVPTIDDDY